MEHLWLRYSDIGSPRLLPLLKSRSFARCARALHSFSCASGLPAPPCPPGCLTSSLVKDSAMATESVFLSALQPNSSITTYGLPSEIGNGNSVSDEASRARRVQQQVQMRMSIKSTLPRQNGSASHYAMSGKQQQVLKSPSSQSKIIVGAVIQCKERTTN